MPVSCIQVTWMRGGIPSPVSLRVAFVLSDLSGSEFTVEYTGILPDLFREGQGILVEGRLNSDRLFLASEVLAKHDENYMPPELISLSDEHQSSKGKIKNDS